MARRDVYLAAALALRGASSAAKLEDVSIDFVAGCID
jgi:hypothetical protein